MGFCFFRVINEDRVIFGDGFGIYGYWDMEIIIYVLEGVLEYKDIIGEGGVLYWGDV